MTSAENKKSGVHSLLISRRVALGALLFAALGAGGEAGAQRGGGGGGAGSLVFVLRRPPRDMVGNIRGWAGSNRAPHFDEDTGTHTWRINMMVFLARPPTTRDVTLSWYRVDRGRGRTQRYLSNETVTLGNPNEPIFFHSTILTRSPGEVDPMEHYVAVISYADSNGQHPLARGEIELRGVVEHRDGVVDFTGAQPQVH